MRKLWIFIATTLLSTLPVYSQSVLSPSSGGGGITSVAALPGTCTAGTTAPVYVNLPWPAGGLYVCRNGPLSGTGAWTPDNPSQPISPLAYGAKWDLKYTYQGIFNGTTTITCNANDCSFQCPGGVYPCSTSGVAGSDVGKNVFGYQSPYSAQASPTYATLLNASTISTVNSATSITVSNAALASCNAPSLGLCILVWYTQDDTTAMNNAASAAWTTPGFCYPVQLPSGNAAFSGPIFTSGSGNGAGASLSYACGGAQGNAAGTAGIDVTQTGPQLLGAGTDNWLVPIPAYNYAGCTFGTSTHGCNFTTPNLSAINVVVNGMGQSTASGNPTVNLAEFNGSLLGGGCTGSTVQNVTIANWLLNDANATGLDLGRNSCGDAVYFNFISELAGATNCQFNAGAVSGGTVVNMLYGACFGGSKPLIVAPSAGSTGFPAIINSQGGLYGLPSGGGSPAVSVNGGSTNGIWNSKGDWIECNFTSIACSAISQTGTLSTVNIDGDVIVQGPTATAGAAIFNPAGAGSTMHIKNSVIGSTGVGQLVVINTTGARLYDEGGNIWTNGGTTKSAIPLGDLIADGHSIKAVCTGVVTASLTTGGIYGTGPNIAATACNAAPNNAAPGTLGVGIPMEGARTLTFLVVTATAAGTNASSGVVTVMKNGVATTMTCTIGTGTSCLDDQHQIAFADGDLLSIQYTTQAADTLAGLKVIVDWSN